MTKKNLTIDDIAQNLGVSKTTVSRAISGKGRISAATRKKIMDYANHHHYRPSAVAQSLAEQRTRNLMLVIPENPPAKLVQSIWEQSVLREYNILLCYATEQGKAVLQRALDNRKIDGVILAADNPRLAELLKRRQILFCDSEHCGELLAKLQENS